MTTEQTLRKALESAINTLVEAANILRPSLPSLADQIIMGEVERDRAALAASAPAQSAAEDGLDRDNEQFNKGVTHVVEMLARAIGAEGWVSGDGSEDYDSDLQQTLMNILAAKGLYDPEDGSYARLQSAAASVGEVRAQAFEECARLAEGTAEFVAGATHERLCHDIAHVIRRKLSAAPSPPPLQPIPDGWWIAALALPREAGAGDNTTPEQVEQWKANFEKHAKAFGEANRALLAGAGTIPDGWRLVPEAAVRCMVTGKPFGTDTWKEGRPCLCAVCKAMLADMLSAAPYPPPSSDEQG